MARHYPRFLYSNPRNTKSKGPFLIHLLGERYLFRVLTNFDDYDSDDVTDGKWHDDVGFGLQLLDVYNRDNAAEVARVEDVMDQAMLWLTAQVKSGFIRLR